MPKARLIYFDFDGSRGEECRVVDHVPKTVFDHCPKLMRLYREVGEPSGVNAWIERTVR
ncbi:MAG: hypothetical protein WDM70_04255 [Nitrosomonadales bacterium]